LPVAWMSPLKGIDVVYPLVPWIGVIALGYTFGPILNLPSRSRHLLCVLIGSALIVAFLVLRLANLYGDPGLGSADAPWHSHGQGPAYAFMSILNTTKYPPSVHYLLMTLGPVIAILPLLENWHGRTANWIAVFGRVPFFFYILHLYVIRLSAELWFGVNYETWGIAPFDPSTWPSGYQPNLMRAYVVWAVLIWIFYWPCRWFAEIRRTYDYRWLSYL
jgi:uncharacterized membrane protein